MTTNNPRTPKPHFSATSPWRKGPHCETKRATASYIAYRRKQKAPAK